MVRRTLDLSDYGTYRGDAAEAQPSLALPVANLKLKLILPRLSHPGVYFVAVATDTTGQHGIARANGTLCHCRSENSCDGASRSEGRQTRQLRPLHTTPGRGRPLLLPRDNPVRTASSRCINHAATRWLLA